MSEPKTKVTNKSVNDFINSIENQDQKKDCKVLQKLFTKLTGKRAKMWGESIIGYGTYHYKYKTGREGDWMRSGFSPRKTSLTIYIMPGFSKLKPLLKKLGPHKTSVSCLYIKKLEQIDLEILEQIIKLSLVQMKEIYPN